jgi:hypothetical protein
MTCGIGNAKQCVPARHKSQDDAGPVLDVVWFGMRTSLMCNNFAITVMRKN